MRTDPRAACANTDERLFWALVHDALCHPLMAWTLYSAWAVQFHDWTSRRAWPRGKPFEPTPWIRVGRTIVLREVAPCFWQVKHPEVDHVITLKASCRFEAILSAAEWFESLAEQLGPRWWVTAPASSRPAAA